MGLKSQKVSNIMCMIVAWYTTVAQFLSASFILFLNESDFISFSFA